MKNIFNKSTQSFIAVPSVVLVVCLIGSYMTRDAMAHLPFLKGAKSNVRAAYSDSLVDQSPWDTVQALAPLAVTAEEQSHARDAERLADHEVDQAFAMALRQATLRKPVLTGEALVLSQKITALQKLVKDDQAHVDALTHATKSTADTSLSDDLDVAKAQLGLDSDQLSDAESDFARATGDDRERIQQELTAREAKMQKYDSGISDVGQSALASARRYGTLYGRIQAWFSQRSRYQSLQQAMQQAQTAANALTAQHNQLEGQANNSDTNYADASSVQTVSLASTQETVASSVPDKAATLTRLHNLSAQREILSILDDRIQTQQQLAAVYASWSAQVQLQHRIVAHLLLQSFALIAFLVLSAVVVDMLIRRLLERPAVDLRRRHTLRTILRLTNQFLALLLILFVFFGLPSQTPTILGLATVGLTVVFQNFILAFFGWFMLMGKNGIRVGDWVEINGVGGEVIEIGLFRTSLLETGNWTDKGHPTGRRVTFVNNFAVTGQYFNFTTSGQWMWDEITVNIPGGKDVYSRIEQIRQAVLAETEKDTRLAEVEWKRSVRQVGLSHFTATPAVDMRPAGSGIDIVVRYVTRANNRFDVRNHIYQCVIDLMHGQQAKQLEGQTASLSQ